VEFNLIWQHNTNYASYYYLRFKVGCESVVSRGHEHMMSVI